MIIYKCCFPRSCAPTLLLTPGKRCLLRSAVEHSCQHLQGLFSSSRYIFNVTQRCCNDIIAREFSEIERNEGGRMWFISRGTPPQARMRAHRRHRRGLYTLFILVHNRLFIYLYRITMCVLPPARFSAASRFSF